MDTDLKCNRLTCRKSLTDKAVVVRALLGTPRTPIELAFPTDYMYGPHMHRAAIALLK